IVPELEKHVLADIMAFTPPGFGPFESYTADQTVKGGEELNFAGLAIEVLSTPGHSPGHVTYFFPDGNALFVGDVLFAGSIGRTDLPGGDLQTLLNSINSLLDRFPDDTQVFSGHMGPTTLGKERANNPFLQHLRT